LETEEVEKFQPFLKDVDKAVSFFRRVINEKEQVRIRIINHFDADGICAGGILSQAVLREGLLFRTTTLSNLEIDDVKRIGREKNWDMVIFTDLGSSKANQVNQLLSRPVIILDHHAPEQTKNTDDFYHVNPHLHGIDGSYSISGAGVAYLFSRSLSPQNRELSIYAVVGALGDRQDKSESGHLTGVNKIIVEDAKKSNLLSDDEDLWFYGYETRDLVRTIQGLNLRGLDRRQRVMNFLQLIQIPTMEGKRSRKLSDLSHNEKTQLFSELITRYDIQPERVFRPVYSLLKEPKNTFLHDGKEFASALNSVGRLKKASVGIALIMGDRKRALSETTALRDEYRKRIGEYIKWCNNIDARYVGELPMLKYFLAGMNIDREFIGTVTSILTSGKVEAWTKKVLVGICGNNDQGYKISIRMPMKLQKQKEWNVDLSRALVGSAIDKFEFSDVGGHSAAAGAILPPPRKVGLQEYDFVHLMKDLNSAIEKSAKDDKDGKEQ